MTGTRTAGSRITLLCRVCQHAFRTERIRDLCHVCRYNGARDVDGEVVRWMFP